MILVCNKNKKGYTLVELLVSMTIFMIITTMAVGAFISISRLRTLARNMTESQQKLRVAREMISRLGFQAQKISLLNNGKDLYLYFNINESTVSGARFMITPGGELKYAECPTISIDRTTVTCLSSGWINDVTLLGDKIVLSQSSPRESKFIKSGTTPATLDVNLYGSIGSSSDSPYFQDSLDIVSKVLLTNLR